MIILYITIFILIIYFFATGIEDIEKIYFKRKEYPLKYRIKHFLVRGIIKMGIGFIILFEVIAHMKK